MSSRSKKTPFPLRGNGQANVSEIIGQSPAIFSSSDPTAIDVLCKQLMDFLIDSSSTDPPNTALRKSVVKGFSHLRENHYDRAADQSVQPLLAFFNRSTKEHRIEIISMLNYLIENFPFGVTCVMKIRETICPQLIRIGEELWSDILSSNVPHQRFQYFQQAQFYLKVLVFLLPKFGLDLEKDQIIAKINDQMINDETILTLELRLTCALVWHLLQEHSHLSPTEKLNRMKGATEVKLSLIALYFALIKTTMSSDQLDTHFFVQLIQEILSLTTRDATTLVGISKVLETYSESLNHAWRNLETSSVEYIVEQLLTFTWDHFSSNIETVRHCSTNIYANIFKVTMNESDLRIKTINSQLELLKRLPWQKDGCALAYHTLMEYISVKEILHWNPLLPQTCLQAMNDRGLASEASHLYSVLCHRHREEEKSKEKWIEIWLKPVLEALESSNQLHRSLLAEYILPKILKGHPEYFKDLREITNHSRTLIVCTRIGRSVAICSNIFASASPFIDEDLIRQGMSSDDEQICLDCLFILCENAKTTEPINTKELKFIQMYLQLNIDRGSTSFRNHSLSLLQKHFIRIKDSWFLCAKQKLKNVDQDYEELTQSYRAYLKWLLNWCCSNLYLEGSYSQRHFCLMILHWIITLHGNAGVQTSCHQLVLYRVEEMFARESMESLLNSLWDTYEDIREYSLQIIVQLKSITNEFLHARLEKLFQRILELLSSTQPPQTASGATLLQCIAQLNHPGIAQLIQSNEEKNGDQIYLLVQFITKKLDGEVQQAKANLFYAAKHGPMYGSLTGINALLKIFQGEKYETAGEIQEWRDLFDHLIAMCLEIASLTGPIVSSSSPEGMMPMELTQINENLSKEEKNEEQITSQMLLVCAWRTIKEISLLFSRLGQIGIKEIVDGETFKFIDLKQIHVISNYFMEQLLKSRHCGAYELAYTGFVIICAELWSSNCSLLCHLPIDWIKNGIKMVEENALDRNKLCLTRRSGGLPFYLQSILTDEPIQQRGQQRTHVALLMNTLLNIIETDPDTLQFEQQTVENSRKIHAYNTVRSFYRNQRFGNDVLPFIERGLYLSIIGFTSSIWMIRNSATLLLSTIVQRIFGPAKSKDGEENLSKKNSMTSREFFNKYPSLFHLFYQQLEQTTSSRSSIESLFAILLILRRLYPSPLDGIDCSLTLDKLLPFVIKCEESPLLRIREHSSKALLALIHRDDYSTLIFKQIDQLIHQPKESIRQNTLHGRFLQLNAIFQSMSKHQLPLTFDSTFNLREMLQALQWCIYENNCSLTQCSYLEFLYNLSCQSPSSELRTSVNEYLAFLVKNGAKVTIGGNDLTGMITRLMIHLENVQIQKDLFQFVEQIQSELSFVEALLLEPNLSLFASNLRRWLIDLLMTMDLFNEQLYTKSLELLSKLIDRTANYDRLTRRIVQLIENLRRPMSLAASFDLIGDLLPLCSASAATDEEDLIKLVYDRMNDFVDGESNDECACAILRLLGKARASLYNSSDAARECQYWGLILKLASFSSDLVRETFTKTMPLIISDQRLTGVFGANCYLTQDVLFESFTAAALSHPSSDLFLQLIIKLILDLLNEIHSGDESDPPGQEEELTFDRRLWPSSEGYNNVFVSEDESCDYYSARYGKALLQALEKMLQQQPNAVDLKKTIEIMREQCNRLIDLQCEAYEQFYIRQRSTVRLNLIIEFLRITGSLQGVNLDKLPQLWQRNS